MFLEEQEYIDKLMLVFFDNLRGIVTDYAQAQYELNQKLINFDYIPKNLQDAFYKKFNI